MSYPGAYVRMLIYFVVSQKVRQLPQRFCAVQMPDRKSKSVFMPESSKYSIVESLTLELQRS